MIPNDADQPWRVAEFWSSADPRRKVLMIAVGDAEIEAWGKRGDFCRWMGVVPSDKDIEALFMQHMPEDSLACAIGFARAVLRAVKGQP